MLIGEIAARSGMSRDTLRYYEREGLLPDVTRNSGGRRMYDETVLDLLRVIKALRGAGFGLTDIRSVLATKDATASAAERIHNLARVLDNLTFQLDRRQNDIDRARRLIEQFRAELDAAPIT